MEATNIHHGQPIIHFGAEDDVAHVYVILLHGRGGSAQGMIPFAEELNVERAKFVIPQAWSNRWYPHPFVAPLESNEPDLSSALSLIDHLVHDALKKGYSNEQVVLGGFSQGACLAAEYAARNAKRYGGLFILSGALIGPQDTRRDYPGSFEGMPVFIGGSDADPWVPHDFIHETSLVFQKMHGEVDFRTYTGMPHTVNQDEVERVRSMLAKVSSFEKQMG